MCKDGNYEYPFQMEAGIASSPFGNSAVMCKGKVTASTNAGRGVGISCDATSPLTTTHSDSSIVAFMAIGDPSNCYFDCTVCDTAYQFNDLASSAQLGGVVTTYEQARLQCQAAGRDLVAVHSDCLLYTSPSPRD